MYGWVVMCGKAEACKRKACKFSAPARLSFLAHAVHAELASYCGRLKPGMFSASAAQERADTACQRRIEAGMYTLDPNLATSDSVTQSIAELVSTSLLDEHAMYVAFVESSGNACKHKLRAATCSAQHTPD